MVTFQPMALHQETERLTLNPFVEADAEDFRALRAERGTGGFERDHVTTDDRGDEVVRLTRALP